MTQEDSEFAVLREADAEECRLGGLEPEEALSMSIAQSDCAYRVVADGEVLAYWGWRSQGLLSGGCNAWMLSTPAIEKHKVFAARASLKLLNELLSTHYRIDIIVSPEHALALKWLRWMGFKRSATFGPFEVHTIQRGGRA